MFHVSSANNPADTASMGLMPSELESSTLWWNGPEFLYQVPLLLPAYECCDDEVPEMRRGVTLMIESHEPFLISWMNRHSNFQKMIRILAFISNLKFSSEVRIKDSLTVQEISQSKTACILALQRQCFQGEFDYASSRPVSKRLMILAASVDVNGIIRVGGRLQNSYLPEHTKSPIILDGRSHFVKVMITHRVHFHMGAHALLALIRQRFWIYRLRQTIRGCISKCLTCFRAKSKPKAPLMGNLPSDRVQPSHSFSSVGIGFAGPFSLKLGTRRNSPIGRSYLCIFVCMSSRAVHLETVSDLSTDFFLASLDRFIAHRGLPKTIRSDCGTNFVGAKRRLNELYTWGNKRGNRDAIHRRASDLHISWIFNPPYSPHFGGIWEAAVKSAKSHLYRTVGDRPMNFEELSTLFSRIEAIMNSCPIGPLNDDPSHGDFLKPGNLLIGQPLLSRPEHDLKDVIIQ